MEDRSETILKVLDQLGEEGLSKEDKAAIIDYMIERIIRAEKQKTKFMNLNVFQSLGYLFEANRCFFHPLGLSLSIVKDDDGSIKLGVLDDRDSPEGTFFDFKNRPKKQIESFKVKSNFIKKEFNKYFDERVKRFCAPIEPLPLE